MRYLTTLASAITLVLLLAVPVLAQKMPPKLEVFGEGGLSFLTGGNGQTSVPSQPCVTGILPCTPPTSPYILLTDLKSSFSETGRVFAGARLRFKRRDAVEVSYSFSSNHLTIQGQGVTGGSAYNRVNLVGINYVHYWFASSRAQPFATVGIGMNRFSGPANASAVVSDLTNATNGFQFAGDFGFGGDVVLQRHLALRFELREYLTRQPAFISGICQGVEPSVGLVYRFK